jgi:hypothetical protein
MKRFVSVFAFLAILIAPSMRRGHAGETEPGRGHAEPDTRILSEEEVSKLASGREDEIRTCFMRHGARQRRATGEVRIHLIVHPDGHVWRVMDVQAPGVRGDKFAACVQARLEAWRFPEKKGYTETTVPYLFVKTWAPGAGPKESCWSPRGCRTRPDAPAKK